LDWQSKKLLVPLRERQATQGPVVRGVGDIVLEWVRGCSQIYADYAGGYPLADNLVREETAMNPLFASWLEVEPLFMGINGSDYKLILHVDGYHSIPFYRVRIGKFKGCCCILRKSSRIRRRRIEIERHCRKRRMN